MSFSKGGLIKIFLFLLISYTLLMTAAGCGKSPAAIILTVDFLNDINLQRNMQPAGHSGNITGDVLYIRIIDNGGSGNLVWESSPVDVSSILQNYEYDTNSPDSSKLTSSEGVFLTKRIITISDSTLSASQQPLQIQAFLYDSEVTAPTDPAADAERYSVYTSDETGPDSWFSSFTIGTNEVTTQNLTVSPQP
jgi:hypothetical protein